MLHSHTPAAPNPTTTPLPQDLDLSSDVFDVQLSESERLPAQLLGALCEMTHLTALDLSRRPAGEEQVDELLRRLPQLHTLTLHGVPIPVEAVARLERRYPHVNIHKRSSVLEATPELATLLGSLSIT